jgi:uncharacterized protein (TIGR02246 family)
MTTTATVADDLAIRNTIARIAHLADMGTDPDEYVENFTDDADWLMPGAPRSGRADIKEGWLGRRAIKQTGPGTFTRHVVSTVGVMLHGPDRAEVDSYWIFYGNTNTAPVIQLMGHYHDTFVKGADGRWRLRTRAITFG